MALLKICNKIVYLYRLNGQTLSNISEPIFKKIVETGQGAKNDEMKLEFVRNGKPYIGYYNILREPIRNIDGIIDGVISIGVEVTEQVIARKKIEESEAFSRSVLESSPDCVKVIDAEGRLQFMNVNGLCTMEIDDFSVFKNKPWSELWGEENKHLINGAIDKALAGNTASFQAFCPTAKGTPKYWDVMVSPVVSPGSNKINSLISVSRDVTEQRHAQKKIEESETLHRQIFEFSPVAIWEKDDTALYQEIELLKQNGIKDFRKYLDTNPEEIFRLVSLVKLEDVNNESVDLLQASSKEEVITSFHKFFTEESIPMLKEGIIGVAENKKRLTIATVLQSLKGKRLEILISFDFRIGNDLNKSLVSLTDFSEQVEARKKIEESEERFHTLADNISQLAWMADAQGWIYWYNQRWYDYTGTTLEEMQGWGWQKVHHPEHMDRVVKNIQHSWDTGEIWEDTFPLRGHDGQYRWFLSRAIPIKDEEGKVLRWFGTNTDITEQKELIEKLNETVSKLNLYEKVVVNIKEAVMITEAEPFNLPGPRIVYVNEAFYNITGYTPEEVIGKTPRILHGPKTDRNQLDKIRKALEQWQPVRVEVVNYRKDGSEFFVEFEIVPVANETGWFTHWVSVQRDVTERKLVEQQIRESQELLRRTKEQLELTFANVPAAIFLYNHKKEILFANERAAHLLGYNTVEELLNERYYDVLMKKVGENYHVTD